ncbi:MAG: uroporphyrinogen decarboxylase family protein, partial [Spirochaetales bacterium]|nr:uroporphyrinogen decarboxylase family protein [Spirochaetales bacterium]
DGSAAAVFPVASRCWRRVVTALERVGLSLAGQFADRRAVGPVLSLYGCRLIGASTEAYYREPDLFLAGQKAVVDRFDPDILFGPFSLALEAEAFGATLAWIPEGPPNVKKPLVPPAGAIQNLPRIDPETNPSLAYLVESVRLLAREYEGTRPVAAVITAPSDLPAILLGIDAWLDLLLFDQKTALEYLKVAEDHFVALGSALFKAGMSFAAVPAEFANPAILTGKLIRELTLPSLERAFKRLPGPIVFHHGANPLADRLGLFMDLPNVIGFALDERDKPALARETLGPERLILAGPAGPRLNRRSAPIIRSAVERLLANRVDDPRMVVVTSAADVPWDTPEENIDAFMSAAKGNGAP